MKTDSMSGKCRILAATVFTICALVWSVSTGQEPDHEFRQWTSENDEFSVRAKLVEFKDFTVKLVQDGGKESDVPVKRLCLADQKYLSRVENWGQLWRKRSGEDWFVGKLLGIKGTKARFTRIDGDPIRVSLITLASEDQESARFKNVAIQSNHVRSEPGAASTIKVPLDAVASESAIRQRIQQCARAAKKIRIDGRSKDWEDIPTFFDEIRLDDASIDIERIGIAPRESDLVVMIQTRGKPSTTDYAFNVRIDFFRQRRADCEFALGSQSATNFFVYSESEGTEISRSELKGTNIRIGDVIEVSIPWKSLRAELPENMVEFVSGKKARPFVQVEVASYDSLNKKYFQHGPSVTSYRLLENEYPLDAPAPGIGERAVPVAAPFTGKRLVANGAFGYQYHQDVYAYDFYIADRWRKTSSPLESTRNEDYYSFGQPILSPVAGTVVFTESKQPDQAPGLQKDETANSVMIALRGRSDHFLQLLHIQENKLDVAVEQRLERGDKIGRVGNSGFSSQAHIHMQIFKPKIQGKRATLPASLEKAMVSLNPGSNDPWTRYVENWEIREGVFVEPVPAGQGEQER